MPATNVGAQQKNYDETMNETVSFFFLSFMVWFNTMQHNNVGRFQVQRILLAQLEPTEVRGKRFKVNSPIHWAMDPPSLPQTDSADNAVYPEYIIDTISDANLQCINQIWIDFQTKVSMNLHQPIDVIWNLAYVGSSELNPHPHNFKCYSFMVHLQSQKISQPYFQSCN
jgi:hypothetical protein